MLSSNLGSLHLIFQVLFRNAVLVSTLALVAGPSHASLITNGDFETGNYTGWTLTNAEIYDGVCRTGSQMGAAICDVHGGLYAMSFGHAGAVTSFTQTLATYAGQDYTLSFWLANDNAQDAPVTTFQVLWNGVSIYSLASPQPSFAYTQLTFAVKATGSSTVLEFRAQQDPSQWFLDDVTVNTPEPGSALLLGAALVVLVGLGRKRAL